MERYHPCVLLLALLALAGGCPDSRSHPFHRDDRIWYADRDADGYGNPDDSNVEGVQPDGYVPVGTDCDDGNAAVHPGAKEICDFIDNDCDVTADEGFDTEWYVDADADGYGDSTTLLVTCTPPGGNVPLGYDCDDHDPAFHPGAAEACDAIDYDCDGFVCQSLSDDPIVLSWTVPSAEAGRSPCAPGDLDGDGQADLIVGASEAVSIVKGPVTSSLDLPDAAAVTIRSSGTDDFGFSVASGIDLDGDGADDLIVGAPSSGDGGAAFVYRGPVTSRSASPDATIYGDEGIGLGYITAPAGDTDGNGIQEFLVTAPKYLEELPADKKIIDYFDVLEGAIYVVPGSISGSNSVEDAATCQFFGEVLSTGWESDPGGYAAAGGGDVNGDGFSDLVLGFPFGLDSKMSGWWVPSASVSVVGGQPGGCPVSLAGFGEIYLEGTGSFGISVHDDHDLDNDGYDDVLIGAADSSLSEETGQLAFTLLSSVYFGSSNRIGDSRWDIEAGPELTPERADRPGWTTDFVPDMNGDGFDEIAIGDSLGDGTAPESGLVWVFYGPIAGGTTYAVDADLVLGGPFANDHIASSLAGEDIDGDGLGELLIGAPGADLGAANGGAVYVW